MFSPSPTSTFLVCLLLLSVLAFQSTASSPSLRSTAAAVRALRTLKAMHGEGLISDQEYLYRKATVLDQVTGSVSSVPSPNTTYDANVQFLLNIFTMGLPRSYNDILPNGHDFWKTAAYLNVGAFAPSGEYVTFDSQIAIQERTLTRYGLNLYDGATWEIALALAGLAQVADVYERNVLYTSSTGSNPTLGGIIDTRSDTDDYKYGVSQTLGSALATITLAGNVTRIPSKNGQPSGAPTHTQPGALFYRMIGPGYQMTDPLDGNYANSWKYPYPDNDTTTPWNQAGEIHWNDWKPILGENVWAAIIGPIQTLWIRTGGNISDFKTFDDAPPQVQMALSIMPALKALQSPLGALYHCPKGTKMFPPDPSEETNVSNENNFSAYAAVVMLYQLLVNKTEGTTDPVLTQAVTDLASIIKGQQKWFASKQYLLNDEPMVVYQGGHVSFEGDFEPALLNETGGFAVDCQTWGLTVLGQEFVDSTFGQGTAYNIWQTTKKLAGYYTPSGELGGVGYTVYEGNSSIPNPIWSAEWSWGAVNMARKLAYEYQEAGNTAYAKDLLQDADSMSKNLQQMAIRCANDTWCGGGLQQEDGSYVYANDRFFIPWGWYANPIGATCSTAWAVMQRMNFNPFVLGGGFVSPINIMPS